MSDLTSLSLGGAVQGKSESSLTQSDCQPVEKWSRRSEHRSLLLTWKFTTECEIKCFVESVRVCIQAGTQRLKICAEFSSNLSNNVCDACMFYVLKNVETQVFVEKWTKLSRICLEWKICSEMLSLEMLEIGLCVTQQFGKQDLKVCDNTPSDPASQIAQTCCNLGLFSSFWTMTSIIPFSIYSFPSVHLNEPSSSLHLWLSLSQMFTM